jgi:hypothetical protein
MADRERWSFYHQPDELKAVFEGHFSREFGEKFVNLPPTGSAACAPQDFNGWKALADTRVMVSVRNDYLQADYRLERAAVLAAGKVVDAVGDAEDLDDSMERRKIIRSGGSVSRCIKRLRFHGDSSVSEIDGVIRLMGWKPVDARSLLTWVGEMDFLIQDDETVAASAFPLLRRSGASFRMTSGVSRMRDRKGPYLGFRREDTGFEMKKRVFDEKHTFLVEVPDERRT